MEGCVFIYPARGQCPSQLDYYSLVPHRFSLQFPITQINYRELFHFYHPVFLSAKWYQTISSVFMGWCGIDTHINAEFEPNKTHNVLIIDQHEPNNRGNIFIQDFSPHAWRSVGWIFSAPPAGHSYLRKKGGKKTRYCQRFHSLLGTFYD